MLRAVPLIFLLAGCISPNSPQAYESESPPASKGAVPQQSELEALRTENEQLRRRIRDLEFWLAQYREMPVDRPKASLVLEVVKDFVLMPKEVYDRVGIENWVYLRRGNQYVGRARVLQISSKGTTARFDTEFPGPATPPRVGDVVVSVAAQ